MKKVETTNKVYQFLGKFCLFIIKPVSYVQFLYDFHVRNWYQGFENEGENM